MQAAGPPVSFFSWLSDASYSDEKLIEIIQQQPSLSYATKDEYQQTTLHYASLAGRYDVVKHLVVQHKTNVNVEDYGGNTPIFYACKGFHSKTVELLLDSRADPSHHNKRDQQCVHILLASKDERNEDGIVCYLHSNESEIVAILKLLQQHGADMNSQDTKFSNLKKDTKEQENLSSYHGVLPSVLDKHIDMLMNIDPNNMDLGFNSNLSLRLQSLLPLSNDDQTDFRIVKKKGFSPLHYAVLNNNIKAIQYLCSLQNINLNIQEEMDLLDPLLLAVNRYLINGSTNLQTIRTLLESSMEPTQANSNSEKEPRIKLVKDKEGNTALHIAASHSTGNQNSQYQLLQLLLEFYGSFVNIKNDKQQYPIHLAVREGVLNIVQLLFQYDCDVNTKDSFGFLPIHEAASFGHTKLVDLLVNYGSDLNRKTGSYPETTALHIAATNGFMDIVKLLMSYNADLYQKDDDQCTAADVAATEEISQILREEGYTQYKIIHEVTITVPKSECLNSLHHELGNYNRLYGNTAHIEYQTTDGKILQGSKHTQEIAERILNSRDQDPTLFVTTPPTGLRLKLKLQTQPLFKFVTLSPYKKTMEHLKHLIRMKLGVEEVTRIELLPDNIQIEDDDDITYLVHDSELQVL